MKLFRERLLARLIEHHAVSEDLARKLLAWRYPRFSAHVGEAISCENKKAIEVPDTGKHRTHFYG